MTTEKLTSKCLEELCRRADIANPKQFIAKLPKTEDGLILWPWSSHTWSPDQAHEFLVWMEGLLTKETDWPRKKIQRESNDFLSEWGWDIAWE